MRDGDIYRQLGDIFREVFSRQDLELRPELTARDVAGWDSFKQIEILLAVEERYDITFHARELDGLNNVGDLARTVLAKTAGRDGPAGR